MRSLHADEKSATRNGGLVGARSQTQWTAHCSKAAQHRDCDTDGIGTVFPVREQTFWLTLANSMSYNIVAALEPIEQLTVRAQVGEPAEESPKCSAPSLCLPEGHTSLLRLNTTDSQSCAHQRFHTERAERTQRADLPTTHRGRGLTRKAWMVGGARVATVCNARVKLKRLWRQRSRSCDAGGRRSCACRSCAMRTARCTQRQVLTLWRDTALPTPPEAAGGDRDATHDVSLEQVDRPDPRAATAGCTLGFDDKLKGPNWRIGENSACFHTSTTLDRPHARSHPKSFFCKVYCTPSAKTWWNVQRTPSAVTSYAIWQSPLGPLGTNSSCCCRSSQQQPSLPSPPSSSTDKPAARWSNLQSCYELTSVSNYCTHRTAQRMLPKS